MTHMISTNGTATWVNQRPNGGIIIQQGPSYVQLSEDELEKLITILAEQ